MHLKKKTIALIFAFAVFVVGLACVFVLLFETQSPDSTVESEEYIIYQQFDAFGKLSEQRLVDKNTGTVYIYKFKYSGDWNNRICIGMDVEKNKPIILYGGFIKCLE